MQTAKAKGHRGSWFATVDGEDLPCVHKYWVKGLLHHDRFQRHGYANSLQILELVQAVRNGQRVILTDDKPLFDAAGNLIGFERKGYIAVYAVDDVTYSPEEGLKFQLVERIRNLE
ncbi:hypothetical protein FJW05_02395 [Mesorhizobium sp. B2-9-1]|uniref:hypothetical protein n=1 Tax=Mesorhizobium sp. B2-9-1 TaxID=2589898 RepID=UPI00112EC935|nr:hypothetical protein [Mesorhizobium sp. B2-9-1]TPI49936.1 hypothetical protein FJW05_02395 [Mesorhizobium sp. B2-9-1]